MAGNFKTYSFKSVGQLQETYEDQQFNTVISNPVGILTPISFAKGSGQMFNMSFNVKEQIRDNLKNLILTNSGERLMLSDLGANLRPLAFELTNDDIATSAIRRISSTVSKYMPFIELETFETRTEPSRDGVIAAVVVRVGYSVPSIGATSQFVEATIYAVG